MTPQRRRILASGIVVALAAGVGLARLRSAGDETRTTVDWPAGQEETYALAWTTKTTSRVMMASGTGGSNAEGGIATNVALEGELVVSSYGKEGDELVLGARFAHLTRAEVNALGKPLLATLGIARNELEGRSVEIFVKPSGEVSRVRFRPRDPALFRYLMQAVVTELDFRVASPGASASAEIEGPSGHGPVRFARDPDRPRLITRTRERYDALGAWPIGEPPPQTLESEGHVTIDPSNGTIVEVVETEKLEAARTPNEKDVSSTTSFILRKSATHKFDARTRPSGFELATGPRAADGGETEEARRERLEARTEGVSVASIVDEIRVHAIIPKGKSTRWGWVATGYLELHPEKCNDLVGQMKEQNLDTDARALTLDVLSSTGHKEAQAAALRAFTDGVIPKGSEEEAILFMRLGWFGKPTEETANFVSARYARAKAESDAPMMRASAIALGSLISAVAKTDRTRARELDDPLVLDLYASKNVKDRAILVTALGNAALEEDAIAIRLQSHDPEADVRRAVAGALRRFDTPDVHRTLLELIGDERLGVQLEAISSLDRKSVSDAELETILGYVEKKKIHGTNVQTLANFLVKRKTSVVGRAILDALAARDDLDAQTRARIIRIRDGS